MGKRNKRTKTKEVNVQEEKLTQDEKAQTVAKEEVLTQPEQDEAVQAQTVAKEEVSTQPEQNEGTQVSVREESLERLEVGSEGDEEVFGEKEQTQGEEKREEKPKNDAYFDIERHINTIKESLKIRPIQGLTVASKHFGFLNAVRNTLGKPNGITILDLDKLYEDNQDALNIDVAFVGALDWKWGDDSKNAYTSLITVLLLRKDGGTIYKKNVQAEFKGQYQELGSVLTSLI